MTDGTRDKIRAFVKAEGYKPIWLCGEMPWPKDKVSLLYEDMDGFMQECAATYEYSGKTHEFVDRTFVRDSDGVKMAKCIAWKSKEPLRQNEPQHEWLNKSGRKKSYLRECSACGHEAYMIGVTYPLCPYCGARMRRESK